jgi:molybdate transport system substrate-binding protein
MSNDGRSRGWRPTRRWAKSAAQREVLDSLDLDPAVVKANFQRTQTERKLRSTVRRTKRRRSKENKRRVAFGIAAVLVALVVVAAGILVVRNVRSGRSKSAAGDIVLTVYAQARLQPVLGKLADDFHAHYPNTTLAITYGQPDEFKARAKSGDVADIYIDHPVFIGWLDAYSTPDVGTTGLGYDALEMILPTANPHKVKTLHDLDAAGRLRVAICQDSQICGSVSKATLQQAATTLGAPAIMPNAVDAIDMVTSGTADAALVMRTDFAAHRNPYLDEVGLDPPAGRVDYSIRRGKKTAATQTFVDYLGTGDGTNALKTMGLLAI